MRFLLQAFCGLISIAVLGCGVAETGSSSSSGQEPAGPQCISADPAVAGPDGSCGVFVSASLGSDDNPGTMERPFRTLTKGFAAAPEGARRVYACAEEFAEAVDVPAGVELWGGLDCADRWLYVGATRKTTIAPGKPGEIALRVLSGDAPSRVADVHAEAADGVEPGQSSIAAMVLPETPVEFLRCELVAGNGAPGADGEPGGGPDAPLLGQPGADGLPGAMGCQAPTNLGAAQVVTVCGDVETIGGKGGDGHITYGDDGDDGQPVPPNPDGIHGVGGFGQNSGYTQCRSGQKGHGGQEGAHGLGGVGSGRLTLEGWEGDKGQDGGDGLPGQGGGGGGALRGPTTSWICEGQPKSGPGGGSGGSGGCGGKGGHGGDYGGASIALILLSDRVALDGSSFFAGHGGDGGRGGASQYGGFGGIQGPGGAFIPGVGSGCSGGPGGEGGNGGFGGGGAGGISVGIVYAGAFPSVDGIYIQPGKGGHGGPGSPFVTLPGTAGEDGVSGDVLEFSQP